LLPLESDRQRLPLQYQKNLPQANYHSAFSKLTQAYEKFDTNEPQTILSALKLAFTLKRMERGSDNS
jgi:hypothetical protein